MDRIASFSVDHNKLLRGLYISRKQTVNDVTVTTLDIRMKKPNVEEVMSTGTIHTIEHIGATYLRNDKAWADRIVYFGPMGCRTGFYLVVFGDYDSQDLLPLMKDTFKFIAEFEGDIPGASAVECGNYTDMDLTGAKKEADKFFKEILISATKENLIYPE
ncbi:MAG: S-ribosylhomocysteine lyase [Clostridia bacterium]|nr:S-ribosylhomocysteine lyase [Clostridia bacterium]